MRKAHLGKITSDVLGNSTQLRSDMKVQLCSEAGDPGVGFVELSIFWIFDTGAFGIRAGSRWLGLTVLVSQRFKYICPSSSAPCFRQTLSLDQFDVWEKKSWSILRSQLLLWSIRIFMNAGCALS